MLQNYLVVALRNLRRQPGYALINGVGLAVGVAACLLILLYLRNEVSYDRHHEKADRIFRLTSVSPTSDRHWAAIGPPVGPAVQAAIPEVEAVTRIFPLGDELVLRTEQQAFEAPGGVFADASLFRVFTMPLQRGNPATALTRPYTAVLSASMTRRFFGDADPVGRRLVLTDWNDMEVTVTGVMADLPATTHLPFDYAISMASYYANEPSGWLDRAWQWSGMYTYLLLRRPEDASAVAAKLPAFVSATLPRDEEDPDGQATYVLQALPDIHLHSKLEKEYRPNGDAFYVYVFAVVAVFILLIACTNFVNLATARAARRIREVGVRKALGAGRAMLVRQFLGEAFVLVLLSVTLAVGLVTTVLPFFNGLAGKTLTFAELGRPSMLAGLAGLLLATGLLSGGYPALVLSGFRPVQALRGTGGVPGRSGWLRRALVVVQFVVSIALIGGTLVVAQQLQYVQAKRLGFDKEHVVDVRVGGALAAHVERSLDAVKQELKRIPAVQHVSLAAVVPGERYSVEDVAVEGRPEGEETPVRIAWGVDHDYRAALAAELAAGRDFSRAAPADTSAWLINESAARTLGLQTPVGTVLRWGDYAGPVVGVVRDFHFASLHHEIEPLVIPLRPGVGSHLLVRVQAGQAPAAVADIRALMTRLAPDEPFRYTFLDESFDRLYAAETRLGDVF
ncbi:MAG TPA: ABC transporter permease, partial [Rhodothermales bacterium]|nr:ABC transporter permease [Rhodothermales bacterium]